MFLTQITVRTALANDCFPVTWWRCIGQVWPRLLSQWSHKMRICSHADLDLEMWRSTASTSCELKSKAKQICFSDVSQRTKNPGNSALSSREAGETSWLSERWGVLGDLHLHPFLIRENVLLEAGPQSPYGEQLQKSVRNVEKQNSPTVQRALMCVGRSQLHTRNLVMWLYRKFYLLKMAQRFLEPQEREHYL